MKPKIVVQVTQVFLHLFVPVISSNVAYRTSYMYMGGCMIKFVCVEWMMPDVFVILRTNESW